MSTPKNIYSHNVYSQNVYSHNVYSQNVYSYLVYSAKTSTLIHMKHQAFFLWEIKLKKIKCRLLQIFIWCFKG